MSEHGMDFTADRQMFEALFDAAARVPNMCEGSEGHLRDDYAWMLRDDFNRCVEADDLAGALDCVLDARDTLARWNERDGISV